MAQKKHTGLIIGLCVFLVLAAVGTALGFLIVDQLEKLPILPNIKVAGVDVGGMTVSQATDAVTNAIGNDYATKDITLQVFHEEVTIPASYSGGTLDVQKAVRAARNFGQVGLPGKVDEQKQLAAVAGYTVNLERYLQIDKDGIMQILENLAGKFSKTLTQSTWSIEGKEPTVEELTAGTVNMELVIQLGTAKYDIDVENLYRQIIAAYGNRVFTVIGNCTKEDPDPVDVDDILSKHKIEPQDAYWDDKNYKVVEAKYGFGFNAEDAKKAIENAQYGTKVTIAFQQLEPELSTQEMTDRMFRDTLATYTAKSPSSSSARKNNLKLACQAVNGIILNPGETFDYNQTLGERTKEAGYKAAGTYVNGETVNTIGGGICQVSSTIYYCALMSDLEIVTRQNHSYPSSYIPLGMDATVSWGGPEFRFRNNSKYPIKIVASASGGNTTVSIMSYDDRDYYTKMEYKVLKRIPYTTIYKTFSEDNAQGYKNGKVITTPYTGYVVESYRVKYDKATDKEISRTFEAKSSYKSRDKVVAKVESSTTAVTPEPSND